MNSVCPHCGFTGNPGSAKFCGRCGGSIPLPEYETVQLKSVPDKARSLNKSLLISQNDPCPCGSGKRYKNCHGRFY